ncbi:MAG: hypothetical protein JOZ08_22450, partial [Verrucomicrobia bacterium]|nr:hypothetical protein [Verrucomicrobiota bacterium]
FAILGGKELAQLNELKKANREDLLIDGLLELHTGLLDDAQADFQSLLEEANQTPEGKDLLKRLLSGIERLRE